MDIQDLKVSNKPKRLRWFDKQNKHKIILDICWSHLKRNKEPYLSVSIIQVKKGGVPVQGWKEQKQVIKDLHCDFYSLVSLHCCGFSDNDRELSNMFYHYELTKKCLAENARTKEEIQSEIDEVYKTLKESREYKLISTNVHYSGVELLISYIEDPYKQKHHIENLANKLFSSVRLYGRPDNFIKLVISTHNQITKLNKEKQSAVSVKDVWTVDRFKNTYDLGQDDIIFLFTTHGINKEDFKQAISFNWECKHNSVLQLSEELEIPLVRS